ncbi:hypothetical protein AK812_SmicGene44324, partial [Symbiodinium microadriaticum]
ATDTLGLPQAVLQKQEDAWMKDPTASFAQHLPSCTDGCFLRSGDDLRIAFFTYSVFNREFHPDIRGFQRPQDPKLLWSRPRHRSPR